MLLVCAPVAATTLLELREADKLRINTWIEPVENIIARQQVKLQIEVATDKWFSGGTRIGHFEIDDAIVLQRDQFAMNSTREEEGKTWTVQQWTLVIYPQRSGSFDIPPIPLALSIASENLETIRGDTKTAPLVFSARQPEDLRGKQDWVATTRFEVSDSFDKVIDSLKPGDALQRSIRITADNLPAMMLPSATIANIPGIAIYAKPAQLNDKVNRGEYLAERNQEITYVFENSGEFELPAETFYWWNLETGAVEVITLPAQSLVVASLGGRQAPEQPAATQTDYAERLKGIPMIYKAIAIAAVLLIAVTWLIRKWVSAYVARHSSAIAAPTGSELLKQANKACRQNNHEKALAYLYQWLDYYGRDTYKSIRNRIEILNNNELALIYKQTMQAIYAGKKSESIDTCRLINRLTVAINKQHRPRFSLQWAVKLKLN